MMRPRWHPGRRLAACVAIGLVANLLVAALCVMYGRTALVSGGTGVTPDVIEGLPVGSVRLKRDAVYRGFGLRTTMDYWTRASAQPRGSGPPYPMGYSASVVQAGWPMLAFTTPFEEFPGTATESEMQALHQASQGPLTEAVLPKWMGARNREIPMRPMPLGFIANTLLWAMLPAIPFFVIPATRRSRRRRAGECIACGYPLGGAPRCPECGLDPSTLQRHSPTASPSAPSARSASNSAPSAFSPPPPAAAPPGAPQ